MKKRPVNQPLYTDELEQLSLDPSEQEVRQLIEADLVPSPSELQKYNQLMPNGADRILTIIEKERKHRHKMEKSKLDGRNVTKIISSAFAFVLGLFMIIWVMKSHDSRLGFALIWAGTVIVLGLIFSSFIKDKLGGGREERDF